MAEPKEVEKKEFGILFTREQIQQRVKELAEQISLDYEKDSETPLVLIGILKGAIPFLTDLAREIKHPNIKIEYMGVSSYASGTESSRQPRITYDVAIPIEDLNVLIVEDIVDTGFSMAILLDMLETRKPKSLKVCSFLSKPDRREIDVNIDYTGFEIENLWVQGYGLDTDEEGRNWDYIAYRK